MADILDAWAWLQDQTDQTEISETDAVERLIWYLNSGGKRNWRIAERPDETNDEEPTPDFLLEEVQHGDLLTVEVKRILPSEDYLKYERKQIRSAFIDLIVTQAVNEMYAKDARGVYRRAGENSVLSPQDDSYKEKIDELIEGFDKFSGTGNTEHGIEKMSDHDTFLLTHGRKDREGSYGVLQEMAERVVEKSQKKFTYCEEAENVLLLQAEPLIGVIEEDILREVSIQAPKIIDRIYVMNGYNKVIKRFR